MFIPGFREQDEMNQIFVKMIEYDKYLKEYDNLERQVLKKNNYEDMRNFFEEHSLKLSETIDYIVNLDFGKIKKVSLDLYKKWFPAKDVPVILNYWILYFLPNFIINLSTLIENLMNYEIAEKLGVKAEDYELLTYHLASLPAKEKKEALKDFLKTYTKLINEKNILDVLDNKPFYNFAWTNLFWNFWHNRIGEDYDYKYFALDYFVILNLLIRYHSYFWENTKIVKAIWYTNDFKTFFMLKSFDNGINFRNLLEIVKDIDLSNLHNKLIAKYLISVIYANAGELKLKNNDWYLETWDEESNDYIENYKKIFNYLFFEEEDKFFVNFETLKDDLLKLKDYLSYTFYDVLYAKKQFPALEMIPSFFDNFEEIKDKLFIPKVLNKRTSKRVYKKFVDTLIEYIDNNFCKQINFYCGILKVVFDEIDILLVVNNER